MSKSRPPFIEQARRGGRRLLRRRTPDDAVVEINNLFARAHTVRAITDMQITEVVHRYGIASAVQLPRDREHLYRDYLLYCLSDHHLTDEEVADLGHLKNLLRLDDQTVDLVHRRVAREVYSRSVDQVLADATVDADERQFLLRLRVHLSIPDAVAENIEEMKRRQQEARDARGRLRGAPSNR